MAYTEFQKTATYKKVIKPRNGQAVLVDTNTGAVYLRLSGGVALGTSSLPEPENLPPDWFRAQLNLDADIEIHIESGQDFIQLMDEAGGQDQSEYVKVNDF